MRRLLAFTAAVVSPLLLTAALQQDRQSRRLIPRLEGPPPVPEALLAPAVGPLTVRLGDLRLETERGDVLLLPSVRFVALPPLPGGGEGVIHLRSLRLDRPVLRARPAGRRGEAGGIGGGPFAPVLGRGVVVEEFVVSGLSASRAAPGGEWKWRFDHASFRATDVRVGAPGADRLRVQGLRFEGELDGRPLAVSDGRIAATRTANRLTYAAGGTIGGSALEVSGEVHRAGDWSAELRADTLAFADARAVVRRLPELGGASLDLRVTGGPAGLATELRRFRAWHGRSRVQASGRLATADAAGDLDLDIRLDPLHGADAGALLGRAPAFQGALTGELRLTGSPEEPALRAELEHVDLPGWALRLDGTLEGGLGGPARVSGRASLLGPQRLQRPDAASAPASPTRRWASAEGGVDLTGQPALDLVVRADSLPLELLPLPAGIDSVSGWAAGEATVRGDARRPTVDGAVRVRDARLLVVPAALLVEGIEGTIAVREDAAELVDVTARAGGGTLRLSGTAAPRAGTWAGVRGDSAAGAIALDLGLELDRVRVLDRDSARATLSGRLTLTGAAERPRLDGRLTVVEALVFEDVLTRQAPLDLESPPYAALAARAPWPSESRLRQAAGERLRAPPLTGGFDVALTPDARVVDEDSRMFGSGVARVEWTAAGPRVRGQVTLSGGSHVLYGQSFRLIGGALTAAGGRPSLTVLAEHEDHAPRLGATMADARDRWPPLEFLGRGRLPGIREEVRRHGLLPESPAELLGAMLHRVDAQPLTGWRNDVFWLPADPADAVGGRARTQAATLLWSYLAEEMYDYVAPEVAELRTGTFRVGGRWPGRLLVGATIGGEMRLRRLLLEITQPLEGRQAPGVRARWRFGTVELEAFEAPLFLSSPAAGRGWPGYRVRRSAGIGLRWQREW